MRSCPRCRTLYSSRAQFCGIDGERLVETADDPLIGARIDRYTLHDRLGAGGMACVYRATEADTHREVAIKLLFGEMASDREFAERLRREAEAAQQIDHPNVVKVISFGSTPEGLNFIAMELLKGRTLDRVILEDAPLPLSRVARIVKQMARGLEAAHVIGFVHRDLKPSNVMILLENGEERVKILDFGLVQQWDILGDGDPLMSRLTRTGVTVGTPYYMAPERMRGEKATPQSDLFALGAVVYEMLTGVPPFRGTLPEIITKQLTERPPMLTVGRDLEPLILRMLERDAKDRPKSAQDVIEAIDKLGLEPPPTMELTTSSFVDPSSRPSIDLDRPPPPTTGQMMAAARVGRWDRGRWAVTLLLLAAAGSGWWWWQNPPQVRERLADRARAAIEPVTVAIAPPKPAPPPNEPVVLPPPPLVPASVPASAPVLVPPPPPVETATATPMSVEALATAEETEGASVAAAMEAMIEEQETATTATAVTVVEVEPPPPPVVAPKIKTKSKAPPPKVKTPPPKPAAKPSKKLASIGSLKNTLDATLRRRGLSMADLEALPRTANLARRFERARIGNNIAEANAAGRPLIDEVGKVSIDDRLISRKLTRVQQGLRRVRRNISPKQLVVLENQYKNLRDYSKKGRLTDQDRRLLLFGAARLERQVASAGKAGG